MAGVTDRPVRILCRTLGAGMAISEMIHSDTSLWIRKRVIGDWIFKMSQGQLVFRLQDMILNDGKGCSANEERGADIIDINLAALLRRYSKKRLAQHSCVMKHSVQKFFAK